MKIDEIKERLAIKYACDYEIAREVVSDNESPYTSTAELSEDLARMEERLPRFGETVVTRTFDNEEWEHGRRVALINNPPEEETYCERYLSWKDDRGRVWYYDEDSGRWVSSLNLMAYVRAIRDELAERLSREAIHEQVGYDS